MQNDQRTPDDDPRPPDDLPNDSPRDGKPALEELPPGREDGEEHGG